MLSRGAVLIIFVSLSLLGTAFAQEPATTQHQGAIVTLSVLILGHDGEPLTDLNQNELKLYEGKEERPIESITLTPGAPAKIGLLIDNSNSAIGALHALKWKNDADPAAELLHGGDLAFVATFTQSCILLCPLTSDLGHVKSALQTAFTTPPPRSPTSLYDAIFWAASEELSASFGRKALIVLSDMEDNMSQHTRVEATTRAQQFGISIYPISMRQAGSRGEMVANSIASKTGGVPFTAYKLDDLKQTFRNIRSDIENTYAIAYRPKSTGPCPIKIRCTRKGIRITAPDQRY